jgi:arylsulfatase A-like enzyme
VIIIKPGCRLFAVLFCGALSVVSVFAANDVLSANKASDRPNIIFLFTDDQTVGAVGCYGNPEIHTPNLDRLARGGVRFVNHYNTTSICMASRASVMTGLYEYRHGCNFDHGNLERSFMEQAYPVLLRKAGYFTGFAGKIGFDLHKKDFSALEGFFDRWAGGPGQTFYETAKNKGIAQYADRYPHSTRAYGAWAQDFLKEAKASGKPFCMSISFKAPHNPPTPDVLDCPQYQGKTLTPGANYGAEKGTHLSAQANSSRAAADFGEWKDYSAAAKKYYALISGIDAAVGMIRDGLEKEGLGNNTVIIYTSDNGYSCGSHGFGDKVLPYEEASKSPLIIYDPRMPAASVGKVSDALTANVDMAPTICGLAGVPAPAGIDGRSLLPLLENPRASVRGHLPLFNFWGPRSAQSMAVVTPEWKYVYWYYGGKGMIPTEEVFHLSEDPLEMVNLAVKPEIQPQLTHLRKLYDTELEAIRQKLAPGYKYEPYPVVFDRTVAWETKAPVAATIQSVWEQSGNSPESRAIRENIPKKKRKKKSSTE